MKSYIPFSGFHFDVCYECENMDSPSRKRKASSLETKYQIILVVGEMK